MPGVTTAYQTGVHGSRPAASSGCILYSCTTHGLVYRSDGTTWTTWLTLPSGSSSASPALTFGTAAAAGAAATFVATDATLPIFDATVPVTQAFSDAAAVGTAAFAARRDHKHGMPASPGGGSLTTADGKLSGDVTMTTANTFYDGPNTGSLAAGTWMVSYRALFSVGSAIKTQYIVKLWDGTTVYDEAQSDMTGVSAATYFFQVAGPAVVVVLAGTATLKISATSSANSQTMLRDVDNGTVHGTVHSATRISAVKVA